LDRAANLVPAHALLLGDEQVHGQEQHRWGVDRHAGGHPVERDLVEEAAHVVEGGDGDAHPAHLPHGQRVVGVEAELGGEVEGDR